MLSGVEDTTYTYKETETETERQRDRERLIEQSRTNFLGSAVILSLPATGLFILFCFVYLLLAYRYI